MKSEDRSQSSLLLLPRAYSWGTVWALILKECGVDLYLENVIRYLLLSIATIDITCDFFFFKRSCLCWTVREKIMFVNELWGDERFHRETNNDAEGKDAKALYELAGSRHLLHQEWHTAHTVQ